MHPYEECLSSEYQTNFMFRFQMMWQFLYPSEEYSGHLNTGQLFMFSFQTATVFGAFTSDLKPKSLLSIAQGTKNWSTYIGLHQRV